MQAMSLVVEMSPLRAMDAMDLVVEILLHPVPEASQSPRVLSVLRLLQSVSLNPKPVPGDLALESAKGVQLPDEVVDPFAKDLEMMANDVGVWVVAFRAVHQAILGNRRSPIATWNG
jgi:hypothetical protein